MGNTIKTPQNGYDIKVVRKTDIIKCIDENILDKDVMLALISQLEVDASTFLSEGRWTSLPYLGTLRKNKFKEIINSEENKELILAAKENLDKDKYIVFRKDLRDDITKRIRRERIFNYTVSKFVTKNKVFYNKLRNAKGEKAARFISYTLYELNINEIQTKYRLFDND